MAEKREVPRGPFVDASGELTRQARRFLNLLILKAATQTDASTVSDPPTQAEVNAIVTVINALIDKLQAAGQME